MSFRFLSLFLLITCALVCVRSCVLAFVCLCVCTRDLHPRRRHTPLRPQLVEFPFPGWNISPSRPRPLSFWWYARARAWDMIFAHILTAILHDLACSTNYTYLYLFIHVIGLFVLTLHYIFHIPYNIIIYIYIYLRFYIYMYNSHFHEYIIYHGNINIINIHIYIYLPIKTSIHHWCRAIISSSSSDLSHMAWWTAVADSARMRRPWILGLFYDDDIRSHPGIDVRTHENLHGFVGVCIFGIAGSSDPNSWSVFMNCGGTIESTYPMTRICDYVRVLWRETW